ncbi:thioredoxin family protein [Cytobacillus sp. IB215665]|uniref:thioredoxin family protein n=1 Tax=Cytobacillus sp. IB215665 TaxID=3097357 RepID=UPI002A132EF2|nr:thioredoxin family protein [Cytobacillus sp. IB215665]MDX8366822.1 thioredoxin family protein [Cytobacillus sp. IB215665]
MKKVIIFTLIVLSLFAALVFVTKYQQQQQAAGNPFNKTSLHPETVNQLDDPNYQNIILPNELDEKLANNESATIYFYQSTCPACKVTSPIIVPMAEEMGIDLKLYNLLEFNEGWDEYNIESTPTIVQYKDGKEVSRLNGAVGAEKFESWFKEWTK